MNSVDELTVELSGIIEKINHHPLYTKIHTLEELRIFMQYHVFAVWDFMCLLKVLQQRLVCTGAPWFPPADAQSAHLINSILTEEEGDIAADGKGYICHFDLYIAAMVQSGADIQPIQSFLRLLRAGHSLVSATELLFLPTAIRRFMTTTFSFFELSTPELAATFVYGREAITSLMFIPLVEQISLSLSADHDHQVSLFAYYCKRHIELDKSDHLPKAIAMLNKLMAGGKNVYPAVAAAATRALQARLYFLSQIEQAIQNK